jgi:hypothetical protein
MNIEEAHELRVAWASVVERRGTDEQFLLLVKQDNKVLNHLQSDYDKGTSPYRTKYDTTTRQQSPN